MNPERPWPTLDSLTRSTADAGKTLVERLALYPAYALRPETWLDPAFHTPIRRGTDATGLARVGAWIAGGAINPSVEIATGAASAGLSRLLDRALAGDELNEHEIVRLFEARGADQQRILATADALRRELVGDNVSYIVTRNINYTNICSYRCSFCAFSKGRSNANLRGHPYNLDIPEVVRRSREAWQRGAVEVCLQGGIHPDFTGHHYLHIVRAVKAECPDLHVHAFSPLEVSQGAATLGLSLRDFLSELKDAGLGSLPGTAAEILDDEVRTIICPDKLTTRGWLEVVGTAHEIGLRTTATIMFGHVDAPRHWARHLLHIRRLQARTGGFTEFVPLPFVATETPINLRGQSRLGPTFREALLMHAVARLVFHKLLPNIQASWVKMGREGVLACLNAGANDIGGTLMNESITRAAGAMHGEEMSPAEMEVLIALAGRTPSQRTTLYCPVDATRRSASMVAAPLSPTVVAVSPRRNRTSRTMEAIG